MVPKPFHNYLKIEYPWYKHFLFWIGTVLAWVLFIYLTGQDPKEGLVNKLCYLPSQILVTYTLLYYIIPKLLQQKTTRSLTALLGLAYISAIVARILKIYVYETVLGSTDPKEGLYDILFQLPPLLGQYMIWVFMTPLMIVFIILFFNHLKEKERIAKLSSERNKIELNFLKAQLHPHFLFNTLNNIYALSVQESPKTHEMVNKLYRMVDYMSEKSREEDSTLEKEIALIKDYIDLEKLRYDSRLDVEVNIKIESPDLIITPLIFLSLVENAFKHGASSDLAQPWIKINLRENKGSVICKVSNSTSLDISENKSDYKKGIGIKNIQRQLELAYPDLHTYQQLELPQQYEVIIQIQLDNKLKKSPKANNLSK